MEEQNLLEMRQITKIYPGVVALDKVDFSVKKGEIHALVGENGAGKSTLIKILAGSEESDGGSIFFEGKEYNRYSPHQAMNMGISVIYHEFNLISQMTVEENIFFGKELKKGIFTDKKEMIEKTREVLKELEIDINPRTKVSALSVAYQQLAEIAKAILNQAKIIIMDEPSATLTNKELGLLFKLIRNLKKSGTSIIYISHRLEEIFEIADRVTVFRDGKYISTKNVGDTNRKELVTMMVGRSLTDTFPKHEDISDDILLSVKNITNEKITDISFDLRKGEILGITGLVGSGRTELVRAIFGADPCIGDIIIRGKKVIIRSPLEAIKERISLLPEDRKAQGVILEMTVKFNISISSLNGLSGNGFVNRKKESQLVDKYVKALKIKTPHNEQKVKFLSGGNQQKVILAKWLANQSDIIIFDEPTRGIDVGAKQEIYNLMSELTGQGKGIIMVSSEMPEIIGMCDRIIVLYKGKLVGEVAKSEITQEKLLEISSGEGVLKNEKNFAD